MAARMCVIILRNGFEFVSKDFDTLRFIFLHSARTIRALEYFINSMIFNYTLSSSTGRKLLNLLNQGTVTKQVHRLK